MAKITYSFEDAIQIYHRSSSTIEVFEPLVAEEDWQGIRPDAVRRTEDYFSDDDILPFNMVSMIYTHRDGNDFYFTKYDFNENPIKEYKITYNKSIKAIKTNIRKDRWTRVNRFTVNQLYKGE